MTSLRDLKRSRAIWVDAISINQGNEGKNDDEKMIQISLMGKIYSRAYEVIIWLGPAADGSDTVMEVIANTDVQKMQGPEFAASFAKLSRRSWFFRTWIIQEFALAKFPSKIVCGTRSITSSQFVAVYLFLLELDENADHIGFSKGSELTTPVFFNLEPTLAEDSPIAVLIDTRSAALDNEGNLRPRSLASMLQYYSHSEATDVRDKIYGALGLVSESVHKFIEARREKSIPETYTDAMTYMFNEEAETYNIDVLELYLAFSCPLSLPNPTTHLPSWVPDFSQKHSLVDYNSIYAWFWLYQITRTEGRQPLVTLQHERYHYQVKNIDQSLFKIFNTSLFVKGFLVDQITDITPSLFYQDFARDRGEALQIFESETRQEITKSLDRLYSDTATFSPRDVASDPGLLFAAQFSRIIQSKLLYKVEEICRRHSDQLGRDTPSDEWIIFIWRDLFEGYGLSHKTFR